MHSKTEIKQIIDKRNEAFIKNKYDFQKMKDDWRKLFDEEGDETIDKN
jgi:hypothetical protein